MLQIKDIIWIDYILYRNLYMCVFRTKEHNRFCKLHDCMCDNVCGFSVSEIIVLIISHINVCSTYMWMYIDVLHIVHLRLQICTWKIQIARRTNRYMENALRSKYIHKLLYVSTSSAVFRSRVSISRNYSSSYDDSSGKGYRKSLVVLVIYT